MCLVVGTLARGFPVEANRSADIIFTNRDIETGNKVTSNLQYFWEAFPAGSNPTDRTTYMFTYLDAGTNLYYFIGSSNVARPDLACDQLVINWCVFLMFLYIDGGLAMA